MKTNLKDNIWIDGFDKMISIINLGATYEQHPQFYEVLYKGKTSEIPEELVMKYIELLTPGCMISLWRNYKYDKPQPVDITYCSAKESIQSACPQEYCIIYKIN